MSKKISIIILITSALFLMLSNALAAEQKLKIATTTSLVADLVRNIGGNLVEVSSLMGAGVDPHLYKATQGDLKTLLNSDLIFYNGLHLEGKMSEVFKSLAKKRKVVAVSEGIDQTKLRKPPEFEGQYDPHIWFDPILWGECAQTVANTLSEVLPDKKELIFEQLTLYRAALNSIDAWTREQINKIPIEQRVLVTAHDAFGYFGHAYGVEVLGLQGISTAAEYGVQDVTRLTNIIVDRKIKAIFVESSVSSKSIEALRAGAREKGHQVKIGGQLYSDALGEAGSDQASYLGMLRSNITTIVEALI